MLNKRDASKRDLGSRASWSRPAWTLVAALFAVAAAPACLRAGDEAAAPAVEQVEQYGAKRLNFSLAGHQAFVILPTQPAADGSKPWIWYAPTTPGLPNDRHQWLFTRLLARGFAIGGIDAGTTYGSPAARVLYTQFHQHVVARHGLSCQACLLPQSVGGLYLYNWAAEHPESVQCIGGIYPVCDMRCYPTLANAAPAYGLSVSDLEAVLSGHNPIDRLAPLAKAKIPILHVHGDSDKVVPLATNSQVVLDRYRALDGPIELVTVSGKGHEEVDEFFQSERLLDFLLSRGKAVAAAVVPNAPDSQPPKQPEGQTPAVSVTRRNFIDGYIFDKIERDRVAHAAGAGDAEFLRRVTLDLTGELPQPDQVRAFLADSAVDKRDRLIDTLCASRAWLDRWTYWFGDLFEICSAQLGEGRNPFREYVYNALRIGLPYDKFVREMLTATASINSASGPANLLVRFHVDGAADVHVHHEDTCDEIAVKTCRVFLGVDLECVSCHNGGGHLEKINLWLGQRQRSDVWRQASFFGNIRIVRPLLENQEFTLTNEGTGYNVEADSVIRVARATADVTPTFILTGQRADPQLDPRQELARMLTAHPQFARATVNLIWAEMMGQGIVDPPLAFDLARQDPQNPPPAPWTIQPSHPELLDALARDFVDNHYDLRHVMRVIAQSAAYQLSAQAPDAENADSARYFARRHLRRLSAEMLYDAISQATGVSSEFAINGTNKKIKSATAAYSPEDVGGPAKAFLSQFGQSNRDKAEPTRLTSILQAAALMNSPLVKERAGAQAEGRLKQLLQRDPPLADAALIEELYLAALTRLPSAEELAIAGEMLQGDRKAGAEDLLWVLLNKFDFLFY